MLLSNVEQHAMGTASVQHSHALGHAIPAAKPSQQHEFGKTAFSLRAVLTSSQRSPLAPRGRAERAGVQDAQSKSSRVEWKAVGAEPHASSPAPAIVFLPAWKPPPLLDLFSCCRRRVECPSSASGIERAISVTPTPTTHNTPSTMKRNFGSLNLAALDLNSPFHTSADSAECSLADRFSAMDTNAEDYSMDASSEHSSEENVGFPMERLELHADVHSDVEMDMENAMPDLALPARCHVMSRPRSVNGDVRVSRSLDPASDVPQHLHDQHNVELNALRCLSLKMMLSNLSTPNSSTSANASKSNYAYPGVNEGAKTPLLPIRQPSLQSV